MNITLQNSRTHIRSKFFELKTNDDLANLLEINLTTLTYYAYRLPKKNQYIQFIIPKYNGKERVITAPLSGLKILQQKLNSILQNVYSPIEYAFAFTKKRNVIKNANIHRNSRYILRIDLKDFFDQIHFGRIQGAFMSYPFNFNKDVATTLTNICTYNRKLPQGAPTSPVISNIICWCLDKELSRFIEGLSCKYSRYADDIIISSNHQVFPKQIAQMEEKVILSKKVDEILKKNNFIINDEKISLKKFNTRQLVTGLVVNEFVNVKREYLRNLRKDLFFWEKYGIQEAEKKLRKFIYKSPYKSSKNYKRTIQGKLNFLKDVRGDNNPIYIKLKRWFDYLELHDWLQELKATTDYSSRGYALEDFFNRLFKINKIEAREPFSRRGGADQIDGEVILGDVCLIECKWTKDTDEINKELDHFQVKVTERSGQGAKGIFISIGGWNANTIKNLEVSKSKNILLMNYEDLSLILSNRNLDVDKLLRWKLRKLSSDSNPYASVADYISEIW